MPRQIIQKQGELSDKGAVCVRGQDPYLIRILKGLFLKAHLPDFETRLLNVDTVKTLQETEQAMRNLPVFAACRVVFTETPIHALKCVPAHVRILSTAWSPPQVAFAVNCRKPFGVAYRGMVTRLAKDKGLEFTSEDLKMIVKERSGDVGTLVNAIHKAALVPEVALEVILKEFEEAQQDSLIGLFTQVMSEDPRAFLAYDGLLSRGYKPEGIMRFLLARLTELSRVIAGIEPGPLRYGYALERLRGVSDEKLKQIYRILMKEIRVNEHNLLTRFMVRNDV